MTRSTGVLLVAIVAGGMAQSTPARLDRRAVPPDPAVIVAEERRIRDADIGFYAGRAEHDPTGTLDLARLGALYLERHRETGSSSDLDLAERAAERSAANGRNRAAWQVLIAANIARHRFVAALDAGDRLLALDPGHAGARATKGEILLELGRYPEADRIFTGLTVQRTALNVAPRYARWLELRGRARRAERVLEEARLRAATVPGVPREQLAWFDLRLAELALKFQNPGQAVRWADSGLATLPGDPRLLTAKARALLDLRRPEPARALADSSLGIRFDPATLIVLAQSFDELGDTALAAAYRQILASTLAASPGNVHRAAALYLLDSGVNPDSVARIAKGDLSDRPDGYGFDLYAWALYRAGRYREAKEAMAVARNVGTEDPLLDRHAMAIDAATRKS